MTQETMLEYVVRKLNDGAYKQNVIAERAHVGKGVVSEIANGKTTDPQSSTLQRLHDVFKSLAN